MSNKETPEQRHARKTREREEAKAKEPRPIIRTQRVDVGGNVKIYPGKNG